MWRDITEKEKDQFNTFVTHPLQSYEWGEFRKKSGIQVIQKGFIKNNKLIEAFQLTIHKIPHTSWTIGYLPKSTTPTQEMIGELEKIGKKEKCIFIQIEPNVKQDTRYKIQDTNIVPAAHALFTKYTFELDLTKSEEELLKSMHPKTRYNMKVAQKHGVIVKQEHSEKAFEEYLKLTKETTNRQGFFAHTPKYHTLMWKTLKNQNAKIKMQNLQAHLLVAYYKNEPLVTWILFTFHNTLYYPYGASSSKNREVMASNLMMWEAIKLGKKLGLKKFDMWGSLGPTPDPKDPWYGFHRFKQGYGPTLIEFVGSYDLVINSLLYQGYKIANNLRWLLLRLKI